MKRILPVISIFLMSVTAFADGWKLDVNAGSASSAASAGILPFWARTVQGGYMPDAASTLVAGGADLMYTSPDGLFFGAGTNLVGSLESGASASDAHVRGIVDRLYITAGWKMLHADIGLKPRQREFCDISLTGGDIVMSGYARNLPGVNLWTDWIYFEKGHWVGIKGNFAQYKMMDNRYVKGTLVHNKSIAFHLSLGRKVDLEAGLDHWVQWGGISPDLGERPVTWKDYYRVMFAKPGGHGATDSDRQNALGNHLGREFVRLRWKASKFSLTFQYDMPFEDGRGAVKIQNAPDGVYSLVLKMNDRSGYVTDVVYEYVHTTWQSGDLHDRPATEEEMTTVYPEWVDNYWQRPGDFYYGRILYGGMDNYFNNGEYPSGWTYHGRTLGLPLITPVDPDDDGVVRGMANNRVRAHHFGIKGNMGPVPYGFKATYSSNWGRFGMPADSRFHLHPWQLSLALELELGRNITNLPLAFAVGAYGDFGQLYQNSVGLSLRIVYGKSIMF